MGRMVFVPDLEDYRRALHRHLPPRYELDLQGRTLALILAGPNGDRVPIAGLFPETYASEEDFTEKVASIARALAE